MDDNQKAAALFGGSMDTGQGAPAKAPEKAGGKLTGLDALYPSPRPENAGKDLSMKKLPAPFSASSVSPPQPTGSSANRP